MRAHRNMHVNHCHFGNSSKLESGSGLQNCMPVIDGVETKGMLGGSRLVRGHLGHDSCLSRAAKAYLGEERQGRMARHLTAHTPLKQRSEPLHRGGEHPEDRGRRQDHIAQIQAHIGSAQRVAGTSQRSNPDWQPSSDDQRSTPCALLFNGQIGLLENGLRQDQVFTVAKANITDVSPTPGGGRWCRVAVLSILWSPPTCGHQLKIEGAAQRQYSFRTSEAGIGDSAYATSGQSWNLQPRAMQLRLNAAMVGCPAWSWTPLLHYRDKMCLNS